MHLPLDHSLESGRYRLKVKKTSAPADLVGGRMTLLVGALKSLKIHTLGCQAAGHSGGDFHAPSKCTCGGPLAPW